MRRLTHASIAALIALPTLSACGSPNTSQVPASTAASSRSSATARSARRTTTAIPALSTATPDPVAALRTAINRTKQLDSYRLSFRMGGSGTAGEGASVPSDAIHLTAAANDDNVEFVYGGSTMGPTAQDYRAVKIGDQAYVRGPAPLPGTNEDRWYILDASQSSTVNLPLPINAVSSMLTERMPLRDLVLDGEEALHGQTCARYRGGLAAALGALDGTGRPTTPEGIAAEATPVVERMQAEGFTFGPSKALVWVCPNGFVHQMQLTIAGEKDGSSFTTTADVSVTEPNAAVVIAAPADAVPPGPSLTAKVYNGGNVRAEASLEGQVLGQVSAGQAVSLLAKTADGKWYMIANERGATGW